MVVSQFDADEKKALHSAVQSMLSIAKTIAVIVAFLCSVIVQVVILTSCITTIHREFIISPVAAVVVDAASFYGELMLERCPSSLVVYLVTVFSCTRKNSKEEGR